MPSLDTQTVLREILLAKVSTDGSITSSQEGVALTNDEDTPGANKVYGTNASGTRGWKADPAISHESVTITSAQILDLHNTPITLLAAPGAGSYYRVLSCDLVYNFNTTAYSTSGGTPSVQAFYGTSSTSITSSSTTLIPSVASKVNFYIANSSTAVTLSDIENKAIIFKNTVGGSSYTTGDGTLTCNIVYQTLSI